MKNRYGGLCEGCGVHVAAGAGDYDWGVLYCSVWDGFEGSDDDLAAWRLFCGFTPHGAVCGALWARFLEWLSGGEADAMRAAESARLDAMRAELVSGGLAALATDAHVRSLSAVIVKVCGEGAVLESLSYVEACAVRDELVTRRAKRAARVERDATRAALGYLPCPKCDGSGAYWKSDGRDGYFDDGCFRCGGTGRTPERGTK